jgi:hypothetical protein
VDLRGLVKAGTDQELRNHYRTLVTKKPAGDIVLGGVPMVHQGPKNYSLPATYERTLRYLGMGFDQYTLASWGDYQVGDGFEEVRGGAGGSRTSSRSKGKRGKSSSIYNAGDGSGGTSSISAELEHVLYPLLNHMGLQFRRNIAVQIPAIKTYINQGIPLLWETYEVPEVEELSNKQTSLRNQSTPEQWQKNIKEFRKDIRFTEGETRIRLIVGYNDATDEIAFSDPLGEGYQERWVTLPVANKISVTKTLTAIIW